MPLMGIPSLPELIIIMGVVFLLFGGKKLPELGGAIGESIKNFKKGIKDHEEDAKRLPETTQTITTQTVQQTPVHTQPAPQQPDANAQRNDPPKV